jgi:hypothetical protein
MFGRASQSEKGGQCGLRSGFSWLRLGLSLAVIVEYFPPISFKNGVG